VPIVLIRGSLNLLEPSGPVQRVMGLLYAYLYIYIYIYMGARCWWRSWFRHCATNRKVAGSIPDGVIANFH
jgi:hypothetical protein